jgi:hypothetical protein
MGNKIFVHLHIVMKKNKQLKSCAMPTCFSLRNCLKSALPICINGNLFNSC